MQPTNNAPVWAIIELMGHIRYGGLVSKDAQLGTSMLRVEVPGKDGSFITQFVNPASIYRITICTEQLARAATEAGTPEPLHQWEITKLLPPAPEPPACDPADEPWHDDIT